MAVSASGMDGSTLVDANAHFMFVLTGWLIDSSGPNMWYISSRGVSSDCSKQFSAKLTTKFPQRRIRLGGSSGEVNGKVLDVVWDIQALLRR